MCVCVCVCSTHIAFTVCLELSIYTSWSAVLRINRNMSIHIKNNTLHSFITNSLISTRMIDCQTVFTVWELLSNAMHSYHNTQSLSRPINQMDHNSIESIRDFPRVLIDATAYWRAIGFCLAGLLVWLSNWTHSIWANRTLVVRLLQSAWCQHSDSLSITPSWM